jgi:hypothetical protein
LVFSESEDADFAPEEGDEEPPEEYVIIFITFTLICNNIIIQYG